MLVESRFVYERANCSDVVPKVISMHHSNCQVGDRVAASVTAIGVIILSVSFGGIHTRSRKLKPNKFSPRSLYDFDFENVDGSSTTVMCRVVTFGFLDLTGSISLGSVRLVSTHAAQELTNYRARTLSTTAGLELGRWLMVKDESRWFRFVVSSFLLFPSLELACCLFYCCR